MVWESWSGVTRAAYRRQTGGSEPVSLWDERRCRVCLALASVAQGIEHWFPVPGVAGSNPAGGTHFLDVSFGPPGFG